MKIYIQHASLSREYPAIKRLIANYGLIGYAFYWMSVELMAVNDGWHRLTNMLALRHNRLSMNKIEEILRSSGLYNVIDSEGGIVTLSLDVSQPIPNIEKTEFATCLVTRPWEHAPGRALVSAGTSAPTSALAAAPDGVCAGPNDIESERIRVEREAEKIFFAFIDNECPSLLRMAEPLTYSQYRKLQKQFFKSDIENVLRDMHNDMEVVAKKRSCYETARRWLECRAKL